MDVKNLYKKILSDNNKLLRYYEGVPSIGNLLSANECFEFITSYIKCSKKEGTILFKEINYLKEHDSQRLSHIISTFLLGIHFFHENQFINEKIKNELERFELFKQNQDELENEFVFLWFMLAMFHDLGYRYEKKGAFLRSKTLSYNKGFVPTLYNSIYRKYYINQRKNKDHGIYAGILLYENLSNIRKEHNNEKVGWDEKLEDVYASIAWVITCHNIWFKRVNSKSLNDKKIRKDYKRKGLYSLLLSDRKNNDGNYIDYPFTFEEFPIFSLFCLIDSIDPIKNTNFLSKLEFDFKDASIMINSNDSTYLNKVEKIRDWLLPVKKDSDNKLVLQLG